MMVDGILLNNESFELFPYGLEPYGKILNSTIYSSEEIVNFVSKLILNSKLKPIARKIIEGMKDRTILVGFEKTGKLDFTVRRIKHFFSDKGEIILGYYSSLDKKLVILLDENVNIIGKEIRSLENVIIHELIHMLANLDFSNYMGKVMKDYLFPFYQSLCGLIMERDVSSNIDLSKTIFNLSRLYDKGENPIGGTSIALNTWVDYFLNEDEKMAKQYAFDILLPYERFISKNRQVSSPKYQTSSREMAINFVKAYEIIGINVKGLTIPGQEAIYPSEVIGMCAQVNLDPKIVSLINSLEIKEYRDWLHPMI